MSCSTLYDVLPSGDVVPVEDFPNAWLGAMAIWRDIPPRYGLADTTIFGDSARVWDLARDPAVCRHHRIVLMATFDNYLCRSADFPELAAAFRAYAREVSRECHCGAWADAIGRLPADSLGCGWRQTSVIADPWAIWFEEDEDTSRRYNVFRDSGHSWLFDKLREAVPEGEETRR